jgi:hypothetical protein
MFSDCMDSFFLNPYTAAHVGMLIQPLLIVTLSAALGTKAAGGVPRFDAGWIATEAPVSAADTLGLIVVHYIAHNCLWVLHIWRALNPDQHELVVSYAAQWAILGVGILGNIICVLPAPATDVISITSEFSWFFVPVVTNANSFLLSRVCWTWLVCVQVLVFDSEWRIKVVIIAWLILDVTSLLVLRVVTLPALAVTLLVAAWAYRRFGWRRTATGTVVRQQAAATTTTHPPDMSASGSYHHHQRQQHHRQNKSQPRTNGVWTVAAVSSPEESSSEDEADRFVGRVLDIHDETDVTGGRRAANAKRALAVASTCGASKPTVRPESV